MRATETRGPSTASASTWLNVDLRPHVVIGLGRGCVKSREGRIASATGSQAGHSFTDFKADSHRQRRDPLARKVVNKHVCDPGAKGLYSCSSRQGGSEAIFWCSGLQNQRQTRRFYGFTDLRGVRLDRGRCSHAPVNQNGAGPQSKSRMQSTPLLTTQTVP